MRVVFAGPRAMAATAGWARTAGSTSAGALSLSSISSGTRALSRTSRPGAGFRSAGVGQEHAAVAHRVGKIAQHAHRCIPADARVSDTDSVGQRLARDEILPARIDVAFDHRADHAIITVCDLPGDIARDVELAFVLLLAVSVRAVDHHPCCEAGVAKLPADLVHAWSVVVRRRAATQDDVTILVARRVHDGRVPALGDRQ